MTRAAGAGTDVSEQARHRVLIVGSGFGGLVAARDAGGRDDGRRADGQGFSECDVTARREK